jgi:hypothetical protein
MRNSLSYCSPLKANGADLLVVSNQYLQPAEKGDIGESQSQDTYAHGDSILDGGQWRVNLKVRKRHGE